VVQPPVPLHGCTGKGTWAVRCGEGSQLVFAVILRGDGQAFGWPAALKLAGFTH